MIEFIWPQTSGEWLAWTSAVYLLISAIGAIIAPLLPATLRRWLSFSFAPTGISRVSEPAKQTSEISGTIPGAKTGAKTGAMPGAMIGSDLGMGIAVLLLHPQPLLYLAFASLLFFRALGRLISVISNRNSLGRGAIARGLFTVVIEGILAYFALGYAFGWLA